MGSEEYLRGSITVRMEFCVDAQVNGPYETACRELGLTPDEPFTMVAKKAANEKRNPFEVAEDPF